MKNLNETLAEPLDADHMNRVMLERESILSDIGRLMRSLDMLKDRHKMPTTSHLRVAYCL